jgi:acylphosphatase
MKQLTAYVSGRIRRVGYRARVVNIALALGLTGTVQNLDDGRAKIVVEGEDNDLERFIKAIDIKNILICVDDISWDYSQVHGDFSSFYKLVGGDETDSRLDQSGAVLTEILGAIKTMHADLAGKQDQILEKQDQTIEEIKGLRGDLHPDLAVQLRAVQEDVKAIKARLGMP